MPGLVKLFYSLSNAVPILRELLIEHVWFHKDFQVNGRLDEKNETVNSNINALLHRMHKRKARERSKTDEQG